jgi:SAM-dependent methyltransferase
MKLYSFEYYKWLQHGSRSSAEEIVPILLEIVQPKNIIDIGCGTGEWLEVFKEHGVEEIFGVDGNWVDKKLLKISEEEFLTHDFKQPLHINRTFDLAIALEMVQHIHVKDARCFIEFLTKLAPFILFSAPIPYQGGSGIHVNEQWPEYWVTLFSDNRYTPVDFIRKKIWNNERVEWWYAQNMLLFVRKDYLERIISGLKEYENCVLSPLPLVHPKLYFSKIEIDAKRLSLIQLLRAFPGVLKKEIKRRLYFKN